MAEMSLMKDGASAHRSWTVLLTCFLLSVSKCQSLRGTGLFPLFFYPKLSLANNLLYAFIFNISFTFCWKPKSERSRLS